MIQLSFDTSEVKTLVRRMKRYDKRVLHQSMGLEIENKIVQMIDMLGLVDTANYRNSVNHDFYDDEKVLITDGVKYGKHLEYGTRPHVIHPKNKKALFWKGAEHPVKSVNHPGTKEYAPFRKGALTAVDSVRKLVVDALMRAKK